MRIKIKGHIYRILLRKKVIPAGLVEIIPDFYEAPGEARQVTRGDKLQGKVALITGARKGIGYSVAYRLLKEGAKVIITDSDEVLLEDAVRHLNSPDAAYMVWDITDGDQNRHFKEAAGIFGKVDILVNNAAIKKEIDPYSDFENASPDYVHTIHDTTVMGTVGMCESFVSMFNGGTILNVISNTAVRAAVGIYWMSKWALYDYTKGLSKRLQNVSPITVNGICPGPARTEMMRDYIDNVYLRTPLNKRLALPEEIAELAFLQILSGLNGKSGEILVCDGGESLI